MQQILSLEELTALTDERDGQCISLFMPTHRAGAETQQNAIRFKNLLTEAENHLTENDVDVQNLLAPGQTLLENSLFWQHQLDGLALFLAQDEPAHEYRVPLHLDELVVVGNRFHTKPLLPLLTGDGQFYVLALSQQAIRLLRGTRDSVSEVELEEVPQGIDEALWFEDPERRLQFHTATGSPGTAGRPAIFYGHGVSTESNEKEIILRYFHRVDKGIQTLLSDEEAPLVLAGVDYLLPIYHQANTYSPILENGIIGNPDTLSAEELHQKAWDIVQPKFAEAQQQAKDQYNDLANTERASKDLKEIVTAAHHGRIDTVFVAVDRQQWGAYDVDTDRLEVFPDSASGAGVDLLDLIATQSLLNSGTVYAVASDKIPGGGTAAAVFRY